MSVALLILCWWHFPYLRIQRIFLIYFHLGLKSFLNVCYPFFSVMLLLWFKWYFFFAKSYRAQAWNLVGDSWQNFHQVFSYMIFQCMVKRVYKFHNHTVSLWKTQWVGSFAWKAKVCTTKVMNLLKFGKVMKIKHSATLPPWPP